MFFLKQFNFKSLDYVGDNIDLLMNNNPRFQTTLGAILTIAITIVGLSLGIVDLKSMFLRANPTINLDKYFEKDFMYNGTGNYPLLISINNRGNAPIPEQERYVQIIPYMYSMQLPDASGKNLLKINKLKTFKCSKDLNYYTKNWGKNAELLRNSTTEERFNRSSCLDQNQDLTFVNSLGDLPSSWLNIFITKCINSTESNIVCKPQQEIDDMLVDSFISIDMLDVYFDGNNYIDPGQIYSRTTTYTVSTQFYKRHYIDIHKSDYITDSGYIFDDISYQNYTQISGFVLDGDLRKGGQFPGVFAEISWRFSKVKDIYNRKYTKFQGVLAEVGGFLTALKMLAYSLNYFVSRKLYFLDLFDLNFNDSDLTLFKDEIKRGINKENKENKEIKENKENNGDNEKPYKDLGLSSGNKEKDSVNVIQFKPKNEVLKLKDKKENINEGLPLPNSNTSKKQVVNEKNDTQASSNSLNIVDGSNIQMTSKHKSLFSSGVISEMVKPNNELAYEADKTNIKSEFSKKSVKNSNNKKIEFWNILFCCCLSKEIKDKLKYTELIISRYINVDNLIKVQVKVGMMLNIMNIKDKIDEIYDLNHLDFVKESIIQHHCEKNEGSSLQNR